MTRWSVSVLHPHHHPQKFEFNVLLFSKQNDKATEAIRRASYEWLWLCVSYFSSLKTLQTLKCSHIIKWNYLMRSLSKTEMCLGSVSEFFDILCHSIEFIKNSLTLKRVYEYTSPSRKRNGATILLLELFMIIFVVRYLNNSFDAVRRNIYLYTNNSTYATQADKDFRKRV